MPTLDDLLQQSMLFTALRERHMPPVPVSTAFRSAKPLPQTAADLGGELDEETIRLNPIWQFSWDPEQPGTFTRITVLSRGMGMDYGMPATVYAKLEFREVKVRREDGTVVDLYLDPEHMIGAWRGSVGEIVPKPISSLFRKEVDLWPLPALIDSSMLVAFGYRLDAPTPSPLTRADCDELGDALIPAPDAPTPGVAFIAGKNSRARVCVGEARYIVLVELVLCKEYNDFVPEGLMGFARIHPHALVWSNENLDRVEATIVMARPKDAMAHSEAMHGVHKALVVADTNQNHQVAQSVPIPYADGIYDYMETEPARKFEGRKPSTFDHPLQRDGEITLADSRFKRRRILEGAVQLRRSIVISNDTDVVKEPRQGQFDNVHIAPRMRLVMSMPSGEDVLVDDDISMVFVCMHDCCHMHVRWSSLFSDKIIAGWKDGRPNAEPGAPAVPEDQTVFASFPNEHTLRYRAVAEGSATASPARGAKQRTVVKAGSLTVFCHHGAGYAIDEWPGQKTKIAMMRGVLEFQANQFDEPYWAGTPNDVWSLFYFRVRYTAKTRGMLDPNWDVCPRLVFDLEKCMQ